jgi:hypothetical protein
VWRPEENRTSGEIAVYFGIYLPSAVMDLSVKDFIYWGPGSGKNALKSLCLPIGPATEIILLRPGQGVGLKILRGGVAFLIGKIIPF